MTRLFHKVPACGLYNPEGGCGLVVRPLEIFTEDEINSRKSNVLEVAFSQKRNADIVGTLVGR